MSVTYRPALRGRLVLSATVLALVAGQPALAQENEGVFQMLGRLILGTGAAKVAIDTPQAVTALESADFEQTQPASLADLFKAVPGVQVAGASTRVLGQVFNIRGIGNIDQAQSEERIKITVDGAPTFFEQYRMGSFFGDLDLYKRVEVLRGPASSTLYGSGSIGGVVAFTTKDASDYLGEGDSTAVNVKTGGNSNGDGLSYGVTVAQRAGNAEFLANVNHSQSGAMVDGDGTTIQGSESDVDSLLLKGKVAFGDDGSQSVTFAYSQTDTSLNDSPVVQSGGASAVPGADFYFGTADITTKASTASLTYAMGAPDNDLVDLTVQLTRTVNDVSKRDFQNASMSMFGMTFPIACAAGQSQVLCDSDFGYTTDTLKIENRADLSFGLWENYLTFGAQLSSQDRTATTSLGAMGFHPEGTDTKTGLYAQGEFVWNDVLTITPGLRFDYAHRTPSADVAAVGGTETYDVATSPKIAALYQVNDAFGIFGSVSRTERMASLDELYSSSATQVPSLNLDKEQASSVEGGVTWQQSDVLTAGDSLNAKITAFDNDLTNMIARNSTGAAGSDYYININRARIKGAELELAYDSDLWFANLAWSRVDAVDLSTGLTLADTPAETTALTLGAKLQDLGLTAGWRANWYDDITTSSVTTTAAAYEVHDAFVTWTAQEGALQGLNVGVTVENVFDTTYRNNLALDNGAGRNVKLAVGKTFTW